MRLIVVMFSVLLLLNCAHNRNAVVDEITPTELREHVSYLASDEMKGRKPGTPESRKAAEYIRDQVVSAGFKPLGDEGFQYFDVVTSVDAGPGNKLAVDGQEFIVKKDFIPLAFSENGNSGAGIVFVDYGFDFDEDSVSWHSYEGVDVSGKFVIILRGDPDPERGASIFESYNSLRSKTLTAKDKGAAGVIFVSGPVVDEKDELIEMTVNQGRSGAGIQVIQVKRSVADLLLQSKNTTVSALESEVNSSRSPKPFALDGIVSVSTDIERKNVTTQNVVAWLEGSDPVLKDEYIIIGAHYDHLGFGGAGSGSRRPDTSDVHNGADDNASGVSSILEIAEKLADNRKSLKRSILFIAFGAEEMGLLGSKKFTTEPLLDLKQAKIMFNLDMVGSLNPGTKALTVGGTGTAIGLSDFVSQYVDTTMLVVNQSAEGYGPSDHASFYIKDIPVLFFFTGVTDEYHTPDDDVDKLNYEGQKAVSDYAFNLITAIDDRQEALVFQEAGPKTRETGGRRGLKVTLGIMPDFSGQSAGGLRADVVVKDRPADLAGMKNGDIITALDGKPVHDIYEYMARLKEFKKGQRISVDVMRGEEKLVLIVEL